MKITLAGGRELSTERKSLVMGILNATPDSFYSDSRKPGVPEGLGAALAMIESGADILDIGGESSRPGASYIDETEEIRRVVPLIKAVREVSDIPISIDTRKAATAEAAVEAGADIINDISALGDDPRLGEVAAACSVPVVLMHKQGVPETMQLSPEYDDAVSEIASELKSYADRALDYGIGSDMIILDPGIGFGKRLEDNLAILRNLEVFHDLGYPLLIGLSRKAFIGTVTGAPVEDRLSGSLAANMYCAIGGAQILRVHDVKETVNMLDILTAIEGASVK